MWTEEEFARITDWIDSSRDEIVELEKQLTAIPAIGPKNGGTGEAEKAAFIKKNLEEWGFAGIEEIRAPADDVPSGYRPSVIARVPGKSSERTIWVMTHLDIVPPGPEELWDSPPYEVIEKEGKLFGRGVEDNQQGMVSSIFAARALIELGLKPAFDVALLLVADEETGSEYGVSYILKENNVFRKEDIIIVPDGGTPEGNRIEVAEKSICWAKVTVKGKQTHASRPDSGVNAMRAGANLIVALDKALHDEFDKTDPVFEPSTSTFEPTKKHPNVDSVNIIPGEDIFYFDCRVLPDYNVDEVLEFMKNVTSKVGADYGVKVNVEAAMKQQSSPSTPVDAQVVKRLGESIKAVYKLEPSPIGIGGGTVAALLRDKGYEAVVWDKMDETAHQPNEYCVISNLLGDAKVFAHLFGQE